MSTKVKLKTGALVVATLSCLSGLAFAEEAGDTTQPMIRRDISTSPTLSSASPDADNTGRNVRDRDERTSTPFDQGSSDSDVEITRKIRKDVMAGEHFSTKAKNVKIITANGKVVLRGPVDSADEKQQINDMAVNAAGASNVINQLEIKAAE